MLPDEDNPVLVYRGVEDERQGRGLRAHRRRRPPRATASASPTPEDCQYLKLRAGETEFITVSDTGEETDAQYQLDLVKINAKVDERRRPALAKASEGPRLRSTEAGRAKHATPESTGADRTLNQRREPMKRTAGLRARRSCS